MLHLNLPLNGIRRLRKTGALALAAAAVAVMPSRVSAATKTWTGGSFASSNWSDGLNWVGATIPTQDGTDTIVLQGSLRTNQFVDLPEIWPIAGLTTASGSSAFTLNTANNVALYVYSGGISNLDNSTLTLNLNVTVGDNQTWNASAGSIVANGSLSLYSGLTLAPGAGNTITVGGAVSSEMAHPNYVVHVGGAGVVLWTGSVPGMGIYNGWHFLNVDSGTLQMGTGGSLGSDSGSVDLTVASGALFALHNTDTTVDTLQSEGTVDVGSATLTIASQGTVSGVISGTGGLTTNAIFGVTLSGANTYTGLTTVSAGTLLLSSANALNSGNDVTVNGGTLILNSISRTFGTLSGVGGQISLGSATLTVGEASDSTFAGAISGSGSLTKQGTGTLTLSGANTYTGLTTVSAGTLLLGSANAIKWGNDVTVNGGTLDLNSISRTLGTLSGTGGTVALGSATLTVGGSVDSTFAGVISGSGSLTKQGSGTLTLSGASTYTGVTTISAGTISASDIVGNSSNLGNAASAVVLGDASNQGTLSYTGAAATYTRGLTINAGGGQLTNAGSGLLTISTGSISTGGLFTVGGGRGISITSVISGSGGLTKTDSNTLTFSGANTYTGLTTVSAGTLLLNSANAIKSGNDVTVNGGTLDLNSIGRTLGTLSGTGGNIALGSASLTVGEAIDSTFAGVISGSGSLTKQGSGTLTLSGANTYNGLTTVSKGTLLLGSANAIKSGNDVTVNGGTLDLNSTNRTLGTLSGTGGTVALGSATLTVGEASDSTFAGVISGSGSLIKQGSSTLTLSGVNTYTGVTIVSAGTLLPGSANAIKSGNDVTVNGGTLDLNSTSRTLGTLSGTGGHIALGSATLTVGEASDSTFAGVISGSGSLTKQGTGTLTLSGSNTYTGVTTISAGTISATDIVGSSSNLGNAASAVVLGDASNQGTLSYTGAAITYTRGFSINAGGGQLSNDGSGLLTVSTGGINAGGVFTVDGSEQDISISSVISGSGGLTKTGSNTLTLSGANTYTGPTTIANGTLQIGNGGAAGSIAGNIANGAALVFKSSTDLTCAGAISGPGSLTKQGASTLTLTGGNTYSGGTTISAGTLQIGSGGNTGSIAGNINNKAALVFNRSNNLTFSGVVSGDGTLTKLGAGQLTLSGANTYSGGTTVAAGTLRIGNGDSTGSIAGNVTDNATLVFNRSDVVTFGGVISGTGALTQLGDGTLTLAGANTYTGLTTVSAGSLIFVPGSLPPANALSIGNDATAAISPSPAGSTSVSTLSSLTIQGTGTLDLGNNDLALSYVGGSPYSAFAALIQSGSIFTSLGHPTASTSAAIALVDNQMLHATMWHGQTISDGVNFDQLLFAYTYAGDSNLDGRVDQRDCLNIIANMGRTGATWFDGDLSGDGIVSPADLSIVSGNLGAGSGGSSGPSLATVLGRGSTAAVPEPGSLLPLVGIGGALLGRRRVRSRETRTGRPTCRR